MREIATLRLKTYSYLADANNENTNVNSTKYRVINKNLYLMIIALV